MRPLQLILILTSATIISMVGLFFYVESVSSSGMPSLEELENPKQNLASEVLSQDGELIDHFFKDRRSTLTYEQIPTDFIDALVATEDREFFNHWGVHLERLGKATFKNIFMGKREGASTITQQLARNLFLDQSPTLSRKIREAITAMNIEMRYTKEEILEMYANTVNFGRGAYGIQMAAKMHFNKKPKDLTTSECAYLVGLLKAPSKYDARADYERAIQRRNVVLFLMKEQSLIDSDDYALLSEEPILFANSNQKSMEWDIAPHFVEDIRQALSDDEDLADYDLYRDGLKISTTLNARVQKYSNEAVDEHLRVIQNEFTKAFRWSGNNRKLLDTMIKEAIRRHPRYRSASRDNKPSVADELRSDPNFIDSLKNAKTTIQCGVVVIEAKTGKILSMVGASPKAMLENAEAKYSLNHSSGIVRQPGSSMKPFVYASALTKDLTPDMRISCGPFVWTNEETGEVWRPRSGTDDCPDESYTMTVAEGLRRSVNSIAARIMTQHTSPSDVKYLLEKSGVRTNIVAVPALALGAGGEVKPIELTAAYGIFANDGVYAQPYYIEKIQDNNGNSIFDNNNRTIINNVLESSVAKEMTIMMQGVVNAGTATRVRKYLKNVDAAGKTGTTNDNADAWFIGYTPELLCGVWVGFDDQRITFDALGNDGQGGRAAAPIFGMLMDKIYKDPTLSYKKRKFEFAPENPVYEVTPLPNATVDPDAPQATNIVPSQNPAPQTQNRATATLPSEKQGNSSLPKLKR